MLMGDEPLVDYKSFSLIIPSNTEYFFAIIRS
jgi:hypothetical protein